VVSISHMASQTSRVGTAPGGRIEPTVAIGRPGTVTDRALVYKQIVFDTLSVLLMGVVVAWLNK